MKQILIKILTALGLYETYGVPDDISKQFKQLDPATAEKVKSAIVSVFFEGKDLKDPVVEEDIRAHLYERLDKFRFRHIPFLSKIVGIKGKRILEIGCGTGSSSIALAEQGGEVYGIDLDEPALKVARQRAEMYGLSDRINLEYANAMELDKVYGEGRFDVAIFFASIEHMTHHERIASLKAAWKVLKKGGVLCILGTPNRLWFNDVHTAFMPFNMWLPDDLAFAYSAFSPRDGYNQFYKRDYKEAETEFLRWGRGVSYHELEVAIKPAAQLEVLGDLHSFQRPKTWLQGLSYKRSDDYMYKHILAKNGPKNLNPGFYEYYLDIAIRKDS